MSIQGVFNDYSRAKIAILKELEVNIHSPCLNIKTKNKTFLGISEAFYTIFSIFYILS